ncbi:MAG: glycosyltransferase [Paludibacteraceae bacterium]|nr:glycosyltransferase [Paludibacteraceae bacterium]
MAQSYQNRYPESIVAIDKPNGHYGSCVNAALKVATGRYFRLLDADDWFDTNALMRFLEISRKIDVDVIFTPFTVHSDKGNILR